MEQAIKLGLYAAGAAVVGVAGYFGYKKVKTYREAVKVVPADKEPTPVVNVKVPEKAPVSKLVPKVAPVVKAPEKVAEEPVVVQTITIEPTVRAFASESPEEAFHMFYMSLQDAGKDMDFVSDWGGARRGYKGLIRTNPVPGFRCTFNEVDNSRLIFHTDRTGQVVVIYEGTHNGESCIMYSAHPDVNVNFSGVKLNYTDVMQFQLNEYRVQ
jgi:hypothetical protein